MKPTIDISDNNEFAFRYACYFGRLNVCQWLLQVKPTIDISFENDWPFCNACERGHLHVAQWLQSLKPKLYVIEYNKDKTYKGYRIRSKKECDTWERRKYLVWLASNHCPETLKDNLLYKLPTDVSRLIVEMI